jgi:hypothetical protein
MCYRRSEFAGIQFLGEGVEGLRILAEEVDVEDGFGVWEVQACEVCV